MFSLVECWKKLKKQEIHTQYTKLLNERVNIQSKKKLINKNITRKNLRKILKIKFISGNLSDSFSHVIVTHC